MRCLALAQAWEGPVRFVSLEPPDWVRERLTREGFELSEQEDFTGATWVLVDGYHFTADYLRAIPAPVVFLDDTPRLPEYPVRWVWNPNISAPRDYGSTPALLGPAYYPLRREFWPYALRPREHPEQARRLLITMGGADPAGFTFVAVAAARRLELELRVIVGGSNPARARLAPLLAKDELVPGGDDMASLLSWGELALAASGVTSYELAFLGVPMVLVALADNQVPVALGLQAAGAAVYLGETPPEDTVARALRQLANDRGERTGQSRAVRRLIDGMGVRRVAARLRGDPAAACEQDQSE